MSKRERLYLETAAILHDAGKYIGSSSHPLHSYNLIRTQKITGFSDNELEIIANITRYHEGKLPESTHRNYCNLSFNERITVSKSAAILQIAEALDISHKQKIHKITVNTNGNYIYFKIKSNLNILLEEWCFTKVCKYFEEIFLYKPVLQKEG